MPGAEEGAGAYTPTVPRMKLGLAPKNDSEQALVNRLHDPGQRRKAFEEVVRRYSPQLYWQIRKMVTWHDDADDVLQNTFLKAWNNIERFRGEAKISTWLFKIAYNEAITFISRRRETLSLDNELFDEESEDSSAAAFTDLLVSDAYFDGDEAQALLQTAVGQLPPKQRAVFCMKYFNETKYEEMARITGTSVGALKASYHLAVKKIEDFLRLHDTQ